MEQSTKERINIIEKQYNLKVSKFMTEVLDLLNIVYNGLHHTNIHLWKSNKFCQKRYITYRHGLGSLATYDFNQLTKLVLLAHEKGIRVSVSATYKNYMGSLTLGFDNRMGKRKGRICNSHPTIYQAIKRLR